MDTVTIGEIKRIGNIMEHGNYPEILNGTASTLKLSRELMR